VDEGRAARRRVSISGDAHVAVGVPILGGRAAYFEMFPLSELERTLSTMAVSLTASAVATTIGGAVFGARLSRRVFRPLLVTSDVAERIAGGEIDQRLPPSRDPEMAPIFDSFNRMVDALEMRIDRERRFAADVSHELRTPLTALVASSAVLDNQLEQLNPRARAAVEILSAQLGHFRHLVVDLLDMARMESGVETANLEPVGIEDLLRQIVSARAGPQPSVCVEVQGPVLVDRRRLERVVSNLVDNADAYAGGAVRIEAGAVDGILRISVDDAGPGVPLEEREAIFERMHRGNAARTSGARGSGLGLALAAEHLRLQGGTLKVGDAPGGGARFVIELPLRRVEP
jgi:signal transduction histidine kinase